MPAAVIPAHVAIRQALRESAGDALALDARLADVIINRPQRPAGNFHGKIDFSQPPWYGPAAGLHLDLHALVRKLEAEMRGEMGFPRRLRGGSDANTRRAAQAVCRLAEGADDFMVKLSARELGRWCRRTRMLLTALRMTADIYEDAEIPRRLPRHAGEKPAVCPWCKRDTLRSFPSMGMIRCIDVTCTDEDGRRPSATLEYSGYAKGMVLRWHDGIVGIPEAA